MDIHRAAARFTSRGDGRQTWHSFSFGPHYDPGNLRFGLLVCHNDELVQPGSGYPDHPHSNLEIVTWVLEGALRHQDSQGHGGLVEPGRVQAMSAGSGVVHAETVDPDAGATRFIQTWLLPDEPGGEPAYSSGDVTPGSAWTPLASGRHPDAVARIGAAAATLWAVRLAAGESIEVPRAPRAHLFLATGAGILDSTGSGSTESNSTGPEGVELDACDSARLTDEGGRLSATSPAELLLWTFD